MNDAALQRFGAESFVLEEPRKEEDEGASYLARLAEARRMAAKTGETVVIDAIEKFCDFLDGKASRNRGGVTPFLDRDELSDVNHATFALAEKFLAAWPVGLPIPEVGSDPDGEVTFDWSGHDGRNFSVSLREDARLAYAGTYGPSKTKHGTDIFNGTDVPIEITDAVLELRREM